MIQVHVCRIWIRAGSDILLIEGYNKFISNGKKSSWCKIDTMVILIIDGQLKQYLEYFYFLFNELKFYLTKSRLI